jgi:hypothetical protein
LPQKFNGTVFPLKMSNRVIVQVFKNADVLTKASMRVWIYSEVIHYSEMKKDHPDANLLQSAGICSSISLCVVNCLAEKKLSEYRPILMMDSFTLKSIYYRYHESTITDLQKWAEICLQCAVAFRKFILDLSKN